MTGGAEERTSWWDLKLLTTATCDVVRSSHVDGIERKAGSRGAFGEEGGKKEGRELL